MNNKVFFPNLWRFIWLVAIQVIVLSEASLLADGYCNVLIYPLFILLLPIKLPTPVAVFLGFLIGLTVDIFTGTLGINASAGAMSGYARAIILKRYAPRGEFSGKEPIASPVYFGWRWFLIVAAIFFGIHIFWYFSMAYFVPVYLFEKILPQALLGWILSMLVVIVLTRIFNPKI